MTNTDILRLVLLIGENDNTTFNKNLLKYIEAVMFDGNQKNYSVEQIITLIQRRFHMEYTDTEIITAISSKSGRKATIIKNPSNDRYLLTPQRVQALEKNDNIDKFDLLISTFISSHTYHFTLEEAKEVLYNFFLNTINENIIVLLELCKRTVNAPFFVKDDFLPDQNRAFINDFLNWDNEEKNKFIYYIISFCWDYCKLTLKSDNSSFRHIFKNKVFFLDSNVIFRLYGINNEERKSVIEAFIKKCESSGIILKYTNFTYIEVIESIHRNIMAISSLTQNKKPLSPNSYVNFINSNTDFLELYCSWCKENNSYSIKQFENSLETGIQNLLRRFKRHDCLDFSRLQLDTRYAKLHEDLLAYKKQRRANNVHPESVAVDVNNWLNISELRNQEKGSDILSIHNFFISADGHLCNWSRQLLPGAVPLVVKPSVWHSILLKFSSRSDDDFKAFLSFLNLRFSENNRNQDPRRPKILVKVLERNYEPELADMVLNYIDSRLITVYKDNDDIELIIDDADEKIISSLKKEAIADVKENILNEGYSKGFDEGEYQAYRNIAQTKANRRILQYDLFRKARIGFSAICLILTFLSLSYIIFTGQLYGFLFWANNNVYTWSPAHWLSLISLLLSVITGIPKIFLKHFIDFYFENGDTIKLQERFLRRIIDEKNKSK